MGRLTYKTNKNERAYCPPTVECNGKCSECVHIDKMMNKLAEYEDAEEQGLLIKLPIPLGKPIYKVCYASKINDGVLYEAIMSLAFYANNQKAFEKGLIYANEEEAEQALAKMKEV